MAKYGVDIKYIQRYTNVMAAVLSKVSHVERNKGKQEKFLRLILIKLQALYWPALPNWKSILR